MRLKPAGMMMDYLWNIDGPIYSLADVDSQREAIAANLMQKPVCSFGLSDPCCRTRSGGKRRRLSNLS